tara:strand:+ start:43 stop:513 length:471 start_codon:yes stop_codon:yes gene_type:complete
MIEGHTFVTAHFTNDERTFVTSIWEDEDGTLRPFNLVAEEGNQYWKELQQYITEDELHENTFKQQKTERKEFEEFALQVAKRDGLITDFAIDQTIEYFLDYLRSQNENKEILFKTKLALFEDEKVKDGERKLKAKLRKAKSLIEVIAVYNEFDQDQ